LDIWGLPGITLFDSLLFSLLAIIVLYLVGFGSLKLICSLSKKTDPFASLDLFQKISFRIFFGFVFVFFFLFIFSLTGLSFSSITLLVMVITIGVPLVLYARSLHVSFRLDFLRKFSYRSYLLGLVVLVIICVTLYFSSLLTVGMFGTTNDDGAFHTSIIRVILDNPSAIFTGSTQPYAAFINTYPSATHVVSAFFVTLFGVPIQKIVLLLSVVLPCLLGLSIYSTLKCLFGSKFLSVCGLVISAFFSFALFWGPICWAGLPLLLSFFVSINALSLVFMFFEGEERTWLNALLIGFCFFIAVNTYPVALLMTFLWFLMLFFVKVGFRIKELRSVQRLFYTLFTRKNIVLLIMLLVPVFFASPYLYNAYTHSNAFLQNYPSDVQFNEYVSGTNFLNGLVKARIDFNWVVDLPSLAIFFSGFDKLFALSSFAIIVLAIFYFARVFKYNLVSKQFFRSACFVYFFFLFMMAFLALIVYVPIGFLAFFDTERVWQHLFILGSILTAVVIFTGGLIFFRFASNIFKSSSKMSLLNRRVTKVLLGILSVIIIFNVGLVSLPVISGSQATYGVFRGSLNHFSSLGSDDITLMTWVKEKVPSDTHILVSAGDSGQYLTAVTQLQTMYSYDMRVFSQSYLNLMSYMTSNPFDFRAIGLLLDYNISYVYIGSIATTYSLNYSFREHFNASKLLSLPYFSVEKQVGDAWLLKFNASFASTAYKSYEALDKAYYWDDRYPVSHVNDSKELCAYLTDANFKRLNADELRLWMSRHISENSSQYSTLIMAMGVAPDTVVNLSADSLFRNYLDSGGHVVWIGDVPFSYQGHKDGTQTVWGDAGPVKVLGVHFLYWDFNATPAAITNEGYHWGMSLPDYAPSQRPVILEDVTTVLSQTHGYPSSWFKNFNPALPFTGLTRYSYQDFNGSDSARINDAVNLAVYPVVLGSVDRSFNSSSSSPNKSDIP
jgi:hypothetical protein